LSGSIDIINFSMPFDFKHKLLSFCFQKSVVQIKYIEFVEEDSTYSGVISYFIYLLKKPVSPS